MFCFRYADDILIDDEVLVQENNELTPAKGTDISTLRMHGKSFHFFCHLSLWNIINLNFYSIYVNEVEECYSFFQCKI